MASLVFIVGLGWLLNRKSWGALLPWGLGVRMGRDPEGQAATSAAVSSMELPFLEVSLEVGVPESEARLGRVTATVGT